MKETRPATSTPRQRDRRRSNGQGSVRALPSGKFQWSVTVGYDAAGKQLRQSGTCRTKTEAQRALNDILARHQRGLWRPATPISFGEFLDEWLKGRQPHLAPATFEQYSYALKHVPYELRRLKIQDVNRAVLRNFQAQLTDKGLSLAVRSKVFGHLRAALNVAVDDGLLILNPAQGLRTTGTVEERSRRRRKALTMAELRTFLAAAENHSFYPLLYTMFSMGLRRGEALGLRWSDVDLVSRTLCVEQQVKLEGNRAILGALKTVSSRRRLPLSDDLIEVLTAHRTAWDEAREFAGASWQNLGLVFTTAIGTPVHPRNVNRAIYALCQAAGLPRFSSHSARHTHITERLRCGDKVEIVAALAGHANANITLGTYREVMEDELRRSAFNLSEHLATER